MQQFYIMRLIVLLVLWLAPGCSAHDPLPQQQTNSDSALTEEKIRRIAEEVAREVAQQEIARAQRERDRRTKEEQQRRNKATDNDRVADEPTAAADEQAVIDEVERSEAAYWLLVPDERIRVDAIREQLSKQGLTKLDHNDLRWAWHGDGQDCLKAELLMAARKAQGELEADTASLGLTDFALLEFFCLEPLAQLQRLHLAKRLVAGDATIEADTIIEFRHDPFLRRLITEYMKGQAKRTR
jgi:hypothetical protein